MRISRILLILGLVITNCKAEQQRCFGTLTKHRVREEWLIKAPRPYVHVPKESKVHARWHLPTWRYKFETQMAQDAFENFSFIIDGKSYDF